MTRELDVTYIGRDEQGRRQYKVHAPEIIATVTATNEEEWEYSCNRCTDTCEHVENVLAARAAFEDADQSIGP